MCGIAGLVGDFENPTDLAHRMLSALRHRGPDDEGVEQVSPTVTLVHSRLAILDLSPAGHQPMADHPQDGQHRNWITYNGEVFNFHALNGALAREGWPSRSRCDTETILNAHRAWGDTAVDRFRGMFAYAIYEADKQTVTLVRDRLGIKPLYIYRPAKGGLVFASELRALLALGPDIVRPRIRRSALESFFAQGAVQGQESIVEGIELVEPGTMVTMDARTGAPRKRQLYWRLPVPQSVPASRDEAVEELRAIAREAVELRLISDVPVGLFLSGGIDSAALLALATETHQGPIRTLSIGLDVADQDESAEAEETAKALGSQHETFHLSGSRMLADLPQALTCLDQPSIDGLNTYMVSQAARKSGLTVALSGLGCDEMFGGYSSFVDVPRGVAFRRKPFSSLALKCLAATRKGRSSAKLAEAARRKATAIDLYVLRRELFLTSERRALHALPAGVDGATGLPGHVADGLASRAAELDPENQVSLFEIEIYMRNMLLRDSDVFSMAAPIELRVPMLDHILVERVMTMPGKWKRPDPRPKPLLIDLAGPRLPKATYTRKKRGFSFPWETWLSKGGAIYALGQDAARDEAVWRNLGLNPAAVFDIWRRFQSGDTRITAHQVFAFIVLRDFVQRHRLEAA